MNDGDPKLRGKAHPAFPHFCDRKACLMYTWPMGLLHTSDRSDRSRSRSSRTDQIDHDLDPNLPL